MVSKRSVALIVMSLLLALAPLPAAKGEPDRVVVQHILIGFKKSVPGRTLDRTKREARALAEQLLIRVEAGEDFDALVKQYTDDRYPGKMVLTNQGVPRIPGGTMRSQVVTRFGDVAFRLEVGEAGLASYHAALSPFGWHVIKRLE